MHGAGFAHRAKREALQSGGAKSGNRSDICLRGNIVVPAGYLRGIFPPMDVCEGRRNAHQCYPADDRLPARSLVQTSREIFPQGRWLHPAKS